MNNNLNHYTLLQAYITTLNFLKGYYCRMFFDDLGSLLGDMEILQDGSTADSASWEYWKESCDHVMESKSYDGLTKLQAFNAMRRFLEIYHQQTSSQEVLYVLCSTHMLKPKRTIDPAAWELWDRILEKVSKIY